MKVTANKDTYIKMNDNLDMDFSSVLEGEKTLEEMGKLVWEEIVKIANGKKTKAEIHGFGYSETVMRRMCRFKALLSRTRKSVEHEIKHGFANGPRGFSIQLEKV